MMTDPRSEIKDDSYSEFFRKFAEFTLRFKWAVILALLGLTAFFILNILGTVGNKLVVDNSIEAFLSSESESLVKLEAYRDVFGRDDVFLVMVEGDVFSIPYLKKLRELHTELAAMNLELPSLGQRKKDRDATRGRQQELPAKPPASQETDSTPELDDGFGDFDDDSNDFADMETDAQWGEEAGGSIVDEITSILNVRKTRYRDDGLEVGELIPTLPSAESLPELKRTTLADNTLVGGVVSATGQHSVIVIRCQFMSEEDSGKVDKEIRRIIQKYQSDDFKSSVAGMPSLATNLNDLMLYDLRTLFVLAMLLQVGVMFFLFRHYIGVFGPLVVVAMSMIWSFGAMAIAGLPMTMISNIIPAFLVCVGIGDSVHLQSVYRDLRKGGVANSEAIIQSVASTGIPIFFTSLTTALGLLSFRFASVAAINELGTIGAIGVIIAFLLSILILPITLSFNTKSLLGVKPKEKNDFIDKILNALANVSGSAFTQAARAKLRGRRTKTLLIGAMIVAVFSYGASTLRVWHNPLSWLPPAEPIRAAFDTMDEHMGGTVNVIIMIDGTGPNGVKDIELLQGLEKLDTHIRQYIDAETNTRIVGNITSVVDVVKETNQSLNGGAPEEYRLPDTQQGVTDRFTMFENAGPERLKRLMTLDASQTHMTIRLRWLEATAYEPLIDHVNAGVEKYIPEGRAKITITGAAVNLFTTVSMLLLDLMRSFGVAFIVITFIMIMLLKSVKLALIAMVPNLMPIVFVMGFMGFAGIPIDMANLMIASIALGVAVDDTIHLLHHYRLHHDTHGDVNGAIAYSLKHAGRAMASTSAILAAGFLVYLAATMSSLQRFGSLIGMTVIAAFVIDVIFVPALLRTFYKNRPSSSPNTHTTGASDDPIATS